MSTLLKNCHLISPDLDEQGVCIEIDGTRIAAVHGAGVAPAGASDELDLGGAMVLPGFVDIHFHGGMGHEVTDASPEAIREIAEAKMADLYAVDLEGAIKTIEGTARSMGIEVVEG